MNVFYETDVSLEVSKISLRIVCLIVESWWDYFRTMFLHHCQIKQAVESICKIFTHVISEISGKISQIAATEIGWIQTGTKQLHN